MCEFKYWSKLSLGSFVGFSRSMVSGWGSVCGWVCVLWMLAGVSKVAGLGTEIIEKII